MDDPAGASANQPDAPQDGPGQPGAAPPPAADPSVTGPLDRATASALLDRGDELLDSGDLGSAARFYERVVGFDDAAITAAALLGLATVFYRADQEDVAIAYWRRVLELPETPGTYLAWRQLAAAHVRAGELPDAIRAYREAERRAPAEDRAEIAARLGWLAKETGDQGAARRYFARSRGGFTPYLTYSIIAVTSVVSLLAFIPDWAFLMDALLLDKPAVAAGEYYRLLTVTLLHGSLFHLLFNMYALYFAGSLVERIYGWRVMGLMYVLTGLAASTASFVFGGDIPSVGASGAVYGMFGVLLAASRTHNPVLDRRGQAVIGQIGILIAINLVISFATPGIDYQAHIGGLLAGIWLGFLFVPGRVPTLSQMWQMPAGGTSSQGIAAIRILGVAALVVVIVVGVMIGTSIRV
jgi:membrane associated rhomboid family serine protease